MSERRDEPQAGWSPQPGLPAEGLNELLINAALEGDPQECEALVRAGADPLWHSPGRPYEGHTALMCAVQHQRLACVNYLITVSDLNARDPGGHTPLMLSLALRSNPRISQALAPPLSDPKALSLGGNNALMLAAHGASEEEVRMLLPWIDPLAQNERGQTALIIAVEGRRVVNAFALLPVSDPNAVDHQGENALHKAIRHSDSNSLALARALLPRTDPDCLASEGRGLSRFARDHGSAKMEELVLAHMRARMEALAIAEVAMAGRSGAPKPRL